MKIQETKMIQEAIEYFNSKLNAEIPDKEFVLIGNRMVEAMARFLSRYKSKDMRVGIEIRTLDTNHEFLFGMAVDYLPPEGNEEENPGSWNVIASMKEDDIKPTDKKVKYLSYDLQSDMFVQQMREILYNDCDIKVDTKDDFRTLCPAVFEVIYRHFEHIMAKTADETYTVEWSLFSIEATKKDESYDTKVLLENEIKQIVKDDAQAQKIEL